MEEITFVAMATFTPSQPIALWAGIKVRPLATPQRPIYSLVTFFSGHSTCKTVIRVDQRRLPALNQAAFTQEAGTQVASKMCI
jgi:hypothetical protein